ncbi:MAG: hypothetical protein EBT09_07725, partial [Actinobacteria bacterium]|nr:hypothetical protein [Actinomycetota bacterium]
RAFGVTCARSCAPGRRNASVFALVLVTLNRHRSRVVDFGACGNHRRTARGSVFVRESPQNQSNVAGVNAL